MTDELFITCARGIAPFLRLELEALGFPIHKEKPTGVWTRGGPREVMQLNLHLRTAMRVLVKLDSFSASNPDALYRKLHRWPWEELLPSDGYLCVSSSVKNEHIRDTRFANLKAKDAIVDRLRAETGERPDSGPSKDGMVVFIYWLDNEVTAFLDSSGIPLSRRSYRINPWKAPMQEALAATCIMASGWDPTTPFVNPMCGSGTLGIEAAWMAMNRAPGLLRDSFGFQFVYGFDEEIWEELCQAAHAAERPLASQIVLSDRDPGALEATQANLKRARINGRVAVEHAEFEQTTIPTGPGTIFFNPPYGERLDSAEKARLLEVYHDIGRFLKASCPGYRGAVFSGNPKLSKQVGLTRAEGHTFFNGAIECQLNLFDIFPADG